MTEWNWDDALQVQREEGREERDMAISKNALDTLAEGASVKFVQKITGLTIEAIERIAGE
jgi:hypothetical protein